MKIMFKNRIKSAKFESVFMFSIFLIVSGGKKNREHYFSYDPRMS